VKLPPPPLTVGEVASYLGVSPDVVRKLVRDKKLKAAKVGGHWRIFREGLVEYVMSKLEKL
jgi:excisionase family DNA binding protein